MISPDKIEKSLDRLRIFLAIDGGGVELVRVTEDGIVEVRLLGSCLLCPMSLMTLRAGIERSLMIQFPEVKRIEQVK
jgi:Fe-S cluster biogenesis protein NfuA